MTNLFYELPDNIKTIIYKYDDNEYNKGLYNEVLKELNKKQIIKFIEYNIMIDNKNVYHFENKISRMFLMDLLSDEHFFKFTDYNEKLNEWGKHKEMMARNSRKYEIAKNYKNHKELYNVIINEYINNDEDDYIYDIIEDFKKWIEEHNYFDKRILKNEVFENWENTTDTDKSDEENESENWTDETYYETDEESDEESDEDNY